MARKSPVIFSFLGGVLVLIPLLGLGLFALVNKPNGSLISEGERRTYLLYVPPTYDPATPTPLVISIHGFAEWPAHQMQTSHWNDLADAEGFIVVYPSGRGLPKRWQADDVTFIADLITHIEQQYNINSDRVYANGLSNGGGMSFIVGCQLSDRIAAIGGVSGAYLYPVESCQPTRPVPMIAFHGTADPVVPYQGGPSHWFDHPFPYIPDWIARRAELNGCAAIPLALQVQSSVTRLEYADCDHNADVILYTIAGGGHTWPGGEALPEFLVGLTTREIEATRLMWEFFQRYSLSSVE